MELKDYRDRIDAIDNELIRLFTERMDTAAGIAAYKRARGLAVLDEERERQKLLDIAAKTRPDLRESASRLYGLLFELSREYQTGIIETSAGPDRDEVR